MKLEWKKVAASKAGAMGYERAEACEPALGVRIIVGVDDARGVWVFEEREITGGAPEWRELSSGWADPFEARESVEHDLQILALCDTIAKLVEIDGCGGDGTLYDSALSQALGLLGSVGEDFPGAKAMADRLNGWRVALGQKEVGVEW